MSGGVRDNLRGPEVGQVVLPARPGGSTAIGERQVNVPLARNNDLPYDFFGASPRTRRTEPRAPAPGQRDCAHGRCESRSPGLAPGAPITTNSLRPGSPPDH